MKLHLLLLLLFFSLLACKQNYVEEEDQSTDASQFVLRPVKLQKLEMSTAPIPIDASGIINSKSALNLSFKIGGIIEKLYAKETERVKKGQLLASIRSTEIDAQVRKAQQGLNKANRDLERIQKMYADTAATLEQVQDLTTRMEIAKSDLEIATFNQKYANIVAPVNGRILKRFSENNELIAPGVPVFRLASNEGKGFVLKIGVADKDVVRINRGDKAAVKLDAYPQQTLQAYVSEIAEAAEPRTGTFSVELTLNAPAGMKLKNGFIGKVTLMPTGQKAYYKIDMEALVEGYQDRANIFIPVKKQEQIFAKKIKVIPAYIGADFFTVPENQLEGITEIITTGAAYLKDSLEIKIIDQDFF